MKWQSRAVRLVRVVKSPTIPGDSPAHTVLPREPVTPPDKHTVGQWEQKADESCGNRPLSEEEFIVSVYRYLSVFNEMMVALTGNGV